MTRPTFEDFASGQQSICVLGLGYVGLPLAAVFARKFKVIGFDINEQRVGELKAGHDRTRELTKEQLAVVSSAKGEGQSGKGLSFSTDPKVLAEARIIIVTVPTPIDDHKNPDLTPLVKSSTAIGRHIKRGTSGSRTFSRATRRSASIPATRSTRLTR